MRDAPSAEHIRLIRKLERLAHLNDGDRLALGRLPLRGRQVMAGVDLVSQGDRPKECCLIVDGWACRYTTTVSGARQIVSFHIPGDLPDRDSLHLSRLDHSICAISPARVAFVPHGALSRILATHPNIAVALWRDGVIDAGVFRQWITNIGRRNARQRLAHLICEMLWRLEALDLSENGHFAFPVTQTQLADALGLSPVHVNRTLQELRSDGLLTWKSVTVTVHDRETLAACADFDPAYLHLKPIEAR